MSDTYIPTRWRDEIAARANSNCEYCRVQSWFTGPFSIDHIVPASKNGTTTMDNLAFACLACNLAKSDRTESLDPLTGVLAPFFNPRNQRWLDHFCWNDDATIIIGLTMSGRATVEALHLNRADVVHLREVLVAFGDHPPADTSG